MPFLTCYYALCTGCGDRDTSGPRESEEEAAELSYFHTVKGLDGTWLMWCAQCDPDRCNHCGGEGYVNRSDAEIDAIAEAQPRSWTSIDRDIVRQKTCPVCEGDGY